MIEEKAGRQFQDDMTPARASQIRTDRIRGKRPSREEARQAAAAVKWTVARLWQEYMSDKPNSKGFTTDRYRYVKFLYPVLGDKEPDTFKLKDTIPWCVLAHIDVQAEVSQRYPGTVATMFQSLAGTDDCNKIFDVTVEKILKYAASRKGERYGLYFETGQGSEFTNGAASGVDNGARVPKVRF